MTWLCHAQDAGLDGGVSAGYSLLDGWLPSYPETTGYIIPTFFDYAHLTGREEFQARAHRMADWEVKLQLPSGAVQAGVYLLEQNDRKPAVFNTGQVILGWCRAFRETQETRYLDAASRAADWLLRVQSDDGSWQVKAPETETQIHTYDVRTAWSLLELHRCVDDPRYLQAARRNFDWALSQQNANGWFENNSFFHSPDKWNLPLTHTIAYTTEGLLEAWRLLGDERYFQAVNKAAEPLFQIFQAKGFLCGEFDSSWNSHAAYSCLPGDAQIAGLWFRLFQWTGDRRYLTAAQELNAYVKATQSLDSPNTGIRGGVKGSHPIHGRYTPFVYVSWGAKFLADSLMLEEHLMQKVKGPVSFARPCDSFVGD